MSYITLNPPSFILRKYLTPEGALADSLGLRSSGSLPTFMLYRLADGKELEYIGRLVRRFDNGEHEWSKC